MKIIGKKVYLMEICVQCVIEKDYTLGSTIMKN